MKYILAPKSKCLEYGIKISGHITRDDSIVLNEKELMFSPGLYGSTVEDRARIIEGAIYDTAAELLNLINS